MIYVTGNKKKFEEASIILKDYSLEQKDLDIPEIQGTAEGAVLRREELDMMLVSGQKGIEQLFVAQQDAVDRANQ